MAPKITTLFPFKTAQIQGGEWKVLKEINDNKLNNLGSAPQSGKKRRRSKFSYFAAK
jgi:hypothetical protein